MLGCTFPHCACTKTCTLKGRTVQPPATPSSVIGARYEVYDGLACLYCAQPMQVGHRRLSPTTDHVIPRSKGGTDEPLNKAIVCAKCNGDKSDLYLHDFLAVLKRKNDPRAAHVQRFHDEWHSLALEAAE